MGPIVPLQTTVTQSRDIDALHHLVDQDMARVNSIILDKAHSDVELIPELAQHLIDSGGKRLRPMLTIAAAKLCEYTGEGHVTLAASVEFMHTATLLHDDVVDESEMRRGKTTARLLWGNEASVLVGDYLLGQAFKMMVEVGSLGALRVLSNAAAIIAEGEVMQLAAAKDLETTEDIYYAVIDAKTAALFAAAAEVGAVIAGRPEADAEALHNFGRHLGLAFQLMDDVLDYSGERARLGKNVGDDFSEGKLTLPVILAYAQGTPEEQAFWRRTIAEGDIHDGDLERAIAVIARHGALESTMSRALEHGERATRALDHFSDGPIKSALLEAVGFSISRTS
ncbi:MAG: polyprenyl synthetase family protein [Dichotomicrobium sp.]